MRQIIFYLVTVTTILSGCASTITKTTQLSVGMTKTQVVELMGKPDSARAQDGVEFLIYKLQPGTSLGAGAACGMLGLLTFGMPYLNPQCRGGEGEDHFVKFEGGRVSSFGKMGDSDPTKDPTLNINIKSQK